MHYLIIMHYRILTDNTCKILGNQLSYLIQVFLGVSVVLSLLCKRHFERPKRPLRIWILDVGKMLTGGFFVHLGNIIVSEFILNSDNSDECSWYFINFFVDCTLGVGVVYISHKTICKIIDKLKGYSSDITKIGFYGNPIDYSIWIKQNMIYLAALFINKIIITSILYEARKPIGRFGNWLFSPVRSKPNLELILVMVICPWILTTLQFWLFDIMLKWSFSDNLDLSINFENIKYENPLSYHNNDMDDIIINS